MPPAKPHPAPFHDKPLTRQESRDLGRAEYWDSANNGLTADQILAKKYIRNHTAHLYISEFHNGFAAAHMLDDDEWRLHCQKLAS